MTKSTLVATAIVVGIATSASAGNMAQPVMEPAVVMEETQAASSATPMIPLIIFAMMVALASNS